MPENDFLNWIVPSAEKAAKPEVPAKDEKIPGSLVEEEKPEEKADEAEDEDVFEEDFEDDESEDDELEEDEEPEE